MALSCDRARGVGRDREGVSHFTRLKSFISHTPPGRGPLLGTTATVRSCRARPSSDLRAYSLTYLLLTHSLAYTYTDHLRTAIHSYRYAVGML